VKGAGVLDRSSGARFPVIVRSGVLQNGHSVHYVLNYSATPQNLSYHFAPGKELLSGAGVAANADLAIEPWGIKIIEENK